MVFIDSTGEPIAASGRLLRDVPGKRPVPRRVLPRCTQGVPVTAKAARGPLRVGGVHPVTVILTAGIRNGGFASGVENRQTRICVEIHIDKLMVNSKNT